MTDAPPRRTPNFVYRVYIHNRAHAAPDYNELGIGVSSPPRLALSSAETANGRTGDDCWGEAAVVGGAISLRSVYGLSGVIGGNVGMRESPNSPVRPFAHSPFRPSLRRGVTRHIRRPSFT
jgi:hypothetical protein